MALNFPTSPILNQIYTSGGNSWKWNGYAWDAYNLNDTIKRFAINTAKTFAYCGEALSFYTESDSNWTIVRYALAADGTVTGEATATNVDWTNYLIHIYS